MERSVAPAMGASVSRRNFTSYGLAGLCLLSALVPIEASALPDGQAAQPRPGSGPPSATPGMTTANRTGGVAPLAVFFDAVDATPSGALAPFTWTSGVYQPADLLGTLYVWDFGDPGSGRWTQTGNSRNTATGFTAAHVYEAPGTYTATLAVTDASGTVRTYAQTITVTAFSGTTYYVAANGSDSNNGKSPSTPFLTAAKGISMAGANRAILFRRGDTFAAGPLTVSAAGPGIIGAYGTGARPIIASTANNTSQSGENVLDLRGSDWRAMDLEIRGTAWCALQVAGNFNLYLRCFVNAGSGVFAGAGSGGETGTAFVDNEIAATSTYGTYTPGRQIAFLGNNIHDIGASHVLRSPQMHKGVISNNRLWNPGKTRQALKLHSDTTQNGGWDTRYVTISDNLFRSDLWTVAIGAQDAGVDERPHHVVLERNRFYAAPGTTASLLIHSSDVLARNNILDATGAGEGYTGIWAVHMGSVVPVESNIRIVNNTIHRGDRGSDFAGVACSSWPTNSTLAGPINVTVRNNLISGPLLTGYKVAVDTNTIQAGQPPGSGFVNDHNLFTAAAGFTNPSAGDFSLQAGSPAVDAGATLAEVPTDYLGTRRPLGKGHDIGAFESR